MTYIVVISIVCGGFALAWLIAGWTLQWVRRNPD